MTYVTISPIETVMLVILKKWHPSMDPHCIKNTPCASNEGLDPKIILPTLSISAWLISPLLFFIVVHSSQSHHSSGYTHQIACSLAPDSSLSSLFCLLNLNILTLTLFTISDGLLDHRFLILSHLCYIMLDLFKRLDNLLPFSLQC